MVHAVKSRATVVVTGAGSGIEVENLLGWVLGIRDERMEFISLQPDRDAAVELARDRERSG